MKKEKQGLGKTRCFLYSEICFYGGLAQLARALAWHARGHRFDPDILHFAPHGLSFMIYHLANAREIFDILTQARL